MGSIPAARLIAWRFVVSALLAFCVAGMLSALTPSLAWGWTGWYKVWTVDEDEEMESVVFSWDSESGVSQTTTEIDINTLQHGFIFETYYDGTSDPLPSSGHVCNSNISCTDADSGNSLLKWEGIWNKQEHTRTTDKLGNPSLPMDDNGYYIGISHCIFFWNLETISVGESLSFTAYITPYIAGYGCSKDNAVGLQTFTLTAGEGGKGADGSADSEEPGDSDGSDDSGDAGQSGDSGASGGSDQPDDQGASEDPNQYGNPDDSTKTNSQEDPEASEQADDSEDTDQDVDSSQVISLSPVSDTLPQSTSSQNISEASSQKEASGESPREPASEERTSAAAQQDDGEGSDASKGESAARLLSFAVSKTADGGAAQNELAVAGLPALFALIVAVLCAMAPVAALLRAASTRFDLGRRSRLGV